MKLFAERLPAGILAGLLLIGCTTPTTPTPSPAEPAPPTNTSLPAPTDTPGPTPLPALASDYDSQVPTEWFNLYLKLAQETPGYTPPVAARTFGYAGVTLYQAVVGGMPDHQSLVGQLNELGSLPEPSSVTSIHWPTAANSALALITRRLFQTATEENLALIDALEHKFETQFQAELPAETYQGSVDYGREVATAVYEWSRSDGGDEGYLHTTPEGYVSPTGEGLWQPTPPQFAKPFNPTWGHNRPFVLESGETCAPPPPIEYSEDPSSAFYAQGLEVYNQVKTNNTQVEIDTAHYWTDNPILTPTPAGHWVSIVTQVIQDHNLTLDVAAEAYARVGITASDAFLGCWNAKYRYNTIRPVTYIQLTIDPNWDIPEVKSPVISPPFPEYTSGHSVVSGAIALVLTDMFGENFAFTDKSYVSREMPARSFSSFYEARDQAVISRLYGGIHFRNALEAGVEQGKCIGQRVLEIQFKK